MRQTGLDVLHHSRAARVRRRDRLADQLRDVDIVEDVGQRVGVDARRVEGLGEQGRQTLGLAVDHGEQLRALLRRELALALLQRLGGADDRRERRADVVGEDRDELGAAREPLAQLLELAAEVLVAADTRRRAHVVLSLDPRERPARVLGEQLVVALGVATQRGARARLVGTDVPERDERVAAEPARVVARDVEAIHLGDELAPVGLEPGDEIDMGRASARACARRRSTPRFHGQTSWQMSQP